MPSQQQSQRALMCLMKATMLVVAAAKVAVGSHGWEQCGGGEIW